MVTICFYKNPRCILAEFGLEINDAETYSDINSNQAFKMFKICMSILHKDGIWKIHLEDNNPPIRKEGQVIIC